MLLRKWDDIPDFMRCDEVKEYYDILSKKKFQLILKRLFDIVVACILLVILAIPMLIIAILIKVDSPGPVFYRQERVTAYGKTFRIHKFRTMVNDAERMGTAVTVKDDNRITKIGASIRHIRLDEIPQLFDVISGNMSFVGTRPEVPKYVKQYTNEMYATLLLPAAITSEASIRYKDEDKILESTVDVDKVYLEKILPEKMKYNLDSLKNFSLGKDIITMFKTVGAVLR